MPFTLFCREGSPEQVYRFFDENNGLMKGDQDDWSVHYEFPGGFLRKKQTIQFTYERQWCSPPNWPTQILGMTNYVSDFEMSDDDHETVIQAIGEFQFSVGIICKPEITKPDDMLSRLSMLDVDACKATLLSPNLRHADELASFNEQIFAYNWRMVDIRGQSHPVDYANVKIAGKNFDLSWARLSEGDLDIGGEPISKANKEHVQAMMSAARERHKASNWIQGYAALYSTVSSDT